MAKTRSKTPKKAPKPAEKPPIVARQVVLRARYDAAQTTDDNRRHWSNADACSADSSANPFVRRTLRNRCRYEVSNDSYARGIVSTVSNDTIGTGPRPQVVGRDKAEADAIEASWSAYTSAIRLPEKLRTLRASRMSSGEVLAIKVLNPRLSVDSQLDLRVVEPDHLAATLTDLENGNYYDGIRYDEFMNPVSYDILKAHPGDNLSFTIAPGDYDTIPAEYVYHYYRAERPGQRRGVPELTPSLPLFAYRRRYALATIAAAETAANHAGVMYTDAPADSETTSTVAPYDLVELERNGAVTLPMGWKLGQLKPEQPTTNYPDFTNAILSEISRCVDVPFTIAALDSSESNMSAAYMDQSAYAKARVIDRQELDSLLNWHFSTWYREQYLLGNLFNPAVPTLQWYWPQLGQHADPSKVANAQATQLGCGATTLSREYAKIGLDAETELNSQAKSLGIPIEELQKLLLQKLYGNGNIATPQESPAPPPQTA